MTGRHRYPKRPQATNPEITNVAKKISASLTKRNIRHAIIGGLAVNAYGYERATADADFLIADEFRTEIAGDPLGGKVEGKKITVDGVDVDLLFPRAHEEFLDAAIDRSTVAQSLPTIPAEALVYLKLVAGRLKDQTDVVELVKRGRLNLTRIRTYLNEHRPDLVEDFDSLVAQATAEAD